jgi:lysozyme
VSRPLGLGSSGDDVTALQRALNLRAEPRFYPPLIADGQLGPMTRHAFEALGWALGFTSQTLAQDQTTVEAQRLIADPNSRGDRQLQRARQRATTLHERTICFDGAPTYWGLGKALLRAREQGWSGTLLRSDRREGVAERFGKRSQASLFRCFQRAIEIGSCPPSCAGSCNPANRPGQSSHEQRSDASAFPGPVGRELQWYELGLDVSAAPELVDVLHRLGYAAHRPYSSPREAHHVNFQADPGRVLPPEGPNQSPSRPDPDPVPATPTRRRTLTGCDVSAFQADVDWEAVRAEGHTFAIAKVSEGLGATDKVFGRGRWRAMKQAGLIRGAYHFARPQRGRDPRDEAREFLDALNRAGGLEAGDLAPVLDLEAYGAAGKLTASDTLNWAKGFADEIRARIGRRPIIYTGAFWRDTMRDPADDLGCPLWLAAYVEDPERFVPRAWRNDGFALWQFTDQASCRGIAGPCDLNRFTGTTTELARLRM